MDECQSWNISSEIYTRQVPGHRKHIDRIDSMPVALGGPHFVDLSLSLSLQTFSYSHGIVELEDISETLDQSDVNEEVYCKDLYFIDVQPIQTIYPETDTTSVDVEGEQHVPQGEPSVIEFDADDAPLSKERKELYAHDVVSFMKRCEMHTISEMEEIWGVTIEEARQFSR